MAGGLKSSCQKIKHHISLPFVTLQVTNIPEFRFDISKSYVNEFYLPNLKYTLEWNKLILGLEHYYFYKYLGYTNEFEGKITGINLRSYTVFLGRKLDINNLNIEFGIGLSYLNSYIANYVDGFPQWFEDRPCYEFSKYRFLSFISVDRQICKNLTLGFNFRYSPMFKPFTDRDYGYYTCTSPHNHDRINFANLQLFLGYRIGENNQ